MKGYISIQEHQELQAKYNALAFRLEQLERMIFGAKSERFYGEAPADEQLNLFGADNVEEQAEIPTQKVVQHERKVTNPKKKPARQALPEHLPRKENIIPPEGLTDEMVKIGEERSEQLVYVQAKLHVEVTVRPKYVLPPVIGEYGKSPVLIAQMPERFIPKCIAHNTLLASILVDKYVDHLPLYRTIERIFRLSQLRLPKSTVSGWVKQSAERLNLLYEKLVQSVLDTSYLQVDETRMEVLPNSPPPSDERKIKRKRNRKNKPIKRKTERGWLWVYHAPETKLTFCDYDPSRGTNNPARHLKNYKGTVQSDGLEVYEIIAKAFTQIEHYQCLVHARRKFEAALNNDRKRAEHALSVFQQIYELEDRAKEENLSTEALRKLRQEHAKPLLEKLFDWMAQQSLQVLPSEPIGAAMGYMLKRKAGLLHYLTDGKLMPDTNLVENAIRPVAVGRKNYLFAGSHDAAQWSAVFYSFFACCKACGVNPYEWLVDVMNRIPNHSILKLDEMLPNKWKSKGV
jgi:transposase